MNIYSLRRAVLKGAQNCLYGTETVYTIVIAPVLIDHSSAAYAPDIRQGPSAES